MHLRVGAWVGGGEELLAPVPPPELVAVDREVAEPALPLQPALRHPDLCEPRWGGHVVGSQKCIFLIHLETLSKIRYSLKKYV